MVFVIDNLWKKKKIYLKVIMIISFCIVLSGLCGCKKISKEGEKLKDLDFTVVPMKDIPEELVEIIEETKDNVIKKTFTDNENLYIVVGYGSQPTTGYSIAIKELYETKNVICIKTWLVGPLKTDKVLNKITYPYIVVKIEYSDKRVVFK